MEEEVEGVRVEQTTPRFTIVRRSSGVSRYLEDYQQRRRGEVATRVGGDCRWGRSAGLILSRQPWLRPRMSEASAECKGEAGRQGEQVIEEDLEFFDSRLQVNACCGLVVAELRGERGVVRHWWEGGEGVTRLPLDQVRTKYRGKIFAICNLDQVRTEVDLANDDQLELVVAMTCGRLLRLQP